MNTTARKHQGRTIDTEIRLKTTPMRAWQAWADPQHIADWFVDRAEGRAAPGEEMIWFFDTFNYRQGVPIVEAKPGEKFVIGSNDAAGPHGHPYALEITITKDQGDTVMRLVNSGFGEDDRFEGEYDGVVSGWQMALATLKYWLEHHANSHRTHRLVVDAARYAPEALRPLFSTLEGRRSWLEPTLPADGAVLADTGSEVLLSWEPGDGVIALKAFRTGPQQHLALDVSAWSETPLKAETIDAQLRDALHRLKSRLER